MNLVCVNPDGLEGAHDSLGADFFAGRHTIGLWWWEVDAFPDAFRRSFDLVDEVWVGSHHVADALAAVSPVPVVRMPVPVEAEPSSGAGRDQLGLPAGGPLFLFAFDHGGGSGAQEPARGDRGLRPGVRARATGRSSWSSASARRTRPEAHRRLLDAAAQHDHVHVLDTPLSPPDMAALTEACDAYVSLHRSEGFGLTIAEAMLRAKPVVATALLGPARLAQRAQLLRGRLARGADRPRQRALSRRGHVGRARPRRRRGPAAPRGRASPTRRAGAPSAADGDVRAALRPGGGRRAMAARLARVAGLPLGATARPRSLDVAEALRRVRGEPPEPGPDAPLRPLRMPLRRALLRLSRPQATHQRLVDEELVRAGAHARRARGGPRPGPDLAAAELEDIKRQLDR